MNNNDEMIEQDEPYYPDYVFGFGTDEDDDDEGDEEGREKL